MTNRSSFSNLNQLVDFYIVAKTGSYTKAADQLFITEPAVHMQVRALERSLGSKLLDKTGKELKLTECGKILYDYAEKICCLAEEAVSKIVQLNNLEDGSLRLGAAHIAQYFIPPIISSFHKRYPNIGLVLNQDKSCDIVDGILDQRYELGIVGRVAYPPLINTIRLAILEMLIIVSPASKLSQRKTVSIYELANEPLIWTTPQAASRIKVEGVFEKRGLKPRVVVEVENVELIKKLVKEGAGYCCLSELSLREEIRTGELIPLRLKEDRILLDIDLIYQKNKTLSISASAFLRFLEETSRSHPQFIDTFKRPVDGQTKVIA